MKHLLFTLLFVVAPLVGYSQTILHFAYDDAGNRLSRTIVVSSLQSPHRDANTSIELFEDTKVKIQEIGTDLLQIEIPGLRNNARISIYDASGKIYVSSDMCESVRSIDISTVPHGIYILMIDIDGEENTWKLIKK